MPIREQTILDNIVTRLKTITVANGYATNAGNSVHEKKLARLDQAELPALVVRLGPDEIEDVDKVASIHVLPVEVEVLASGADAHDTVRKAVYDVYKAAGVDETWTNQAIKTVARGHDPIEEKREREVAGAVVRLDVHFITSRFQETVT